MKQRIFKIIGALALCLTLAAPAKAKDDLQARAQAGSVIDQFNLGYEYYTGDGRAEDLAKAIFWWEKAAEGGDVDAQRNLGVIYHIGQGVPQDYTKAAKWYEKAAEAGDDGAQNNLAILYENGQGVPQDYTKALYWYDKAAAQGYEDAKEQSRIVRWNHFAGPSWLNDAAMLAVLDKATGAEQLGAAEMEAKLLGQRYGEASVLVSDLRLDVQRSTSWNVATLAFARAEVAMTEDDARRLLCLWAEQASIIYGWSDVPNVARRKSDEMAKGGKSLGLFGLAEIMTGDKPGMSARYRALMRSAFLGDEAGILRAVRSVPGEMVAAATAVPLLP